MNPQHDQHKQRLLNEQVQIAADIAQARLSAATVELDQSSLGRVSRMDALQQQALAQGLLQRLLTRQRKIQAALARFDTHAYGLCCACQMAIEPDRLQVDPAAVFCSECAEER